ncbi:hypothetical protein [Porphyrobacter sp. LM 6]|uniref:hypothetical protein n=1 Tax=Porphyrobacter sp. LM 6 TaxID=1896196 RepID=UPI000846E42A|nr:hypothetical protein [Porphyrobacter sp. LM 6]AOL95419.1 hypothetical protein BG023_112508 [Porphyrobacter sp. LM 6]
MNLPVIDNIWRARGDIPLDSELTAEEAFARLDPLLQAQGTTYSVAGDTLTYAKHNPAAQDKLATFTNGTLQLQRRGAGAVLRYDLGSPALLACFLAPLLFLGFAQLAVAINEVEKPAIEASEKSGKDKDKPKPPKPLNPVDQFLGAPAPEDPTKKKDEEEGEGQHSPTPGYVLAGLFFATYLVGRWLEPWLVRRRFRAALTGQAAVGAQQGA